VNEALRAYEAIRKQKPSARSAFLNDLQQQGNNGRLPDTVNRLVQQRCK
jgi:hypothetical protein